MPLVGIPTPYGLSLRELAGREWMDIAPPNSYSLNKVYWGGSSAGSYKSRQGMGSRESPPVYQSSRFSEVVALCLFLSPVFEEYPQVSGPTESLDAKASQIRSIDPSCLGAIDIYDCDFV